MPSTTASSNGRTSLGINYVHLKTSRDESKQNTVLVEAGDSNTLPMNRSGGSNIGGNGDSAEGDALAVRKTDEYDVDFDNTKPFAVYRWNDLATQIQARLSESDQRLATNYPEWQDLAAEIQARLTSNTSSIITKRQMARIQPLPQVLATLTSTFTELVVPLVPNFAILWGLIYINLKLSYSSKEHLKRTTNLLNKIRRSVELFNRCLEACEEANESRIAVVDFLDPIMVILSDSVTFLSACTKDPELIESWPEVSEGMNQQFELLDFTVKHVNDITQFSVVNRENNIRNMSLKHALIANNDEPGVFPSKLLPFAQNPKFYGRKEEMDRLVKHLSVKTQSSYRTYTIYGRRGVGKTEIALQFAYTNPAGYDAIFWIQCETSVAIRQSFTDVAVKLNLPGAYKDGHHEENLIAVQNWLKKTSKKWLLIFDNAESSQILREYWPMGAAGAILLTSRKYFNFTKDVQRRGDTVKPFSRQESWELLLGFLGDEWKQLEREGKILTSEITAAKNMLDDLEGLPLAIRQAAILIKDSDIGGPTITKTYGMFKERIHTLPVRHSNPRSTSEKALDALWDITFKSLTSNARSLLGVLAWFSPDAIPIELFLPRDQTVLDGPLAFCRQDSIHIDDKQQATLISVATASPEFERAISELIKAALIKQDGLLYSIHRVVQEATNYNDTDDLQTSFNTAAKLVNAQFPKQESNETLFDRWNRCQEYIPHGVYLSRKFADFAKSGVLRGCSAFVELLNNCAWYLHELGDYAVSARVIETGLSACYDKKSLVYADLHNTAGCRYFELNRLDECRKEWEKTMRVRKELLPQNDQGIAAILNNTGNLELAAGNGDEAIEYYEQALKIWEQGGDKAAIPLALTYLCMGRAKMLKGDLNEAMKQTTLAESLFLRTIGADRGFMVNVHYAYGNIHFLHQHWDLAYRAYDQCLKLALNLMPIHQITGATYYSLACVEFARDSPDGARAFLEKARTIGQLRSPDRDDGPLARILWKLAVVLESDTLGKYADEAAALRTRAEVAQNTLLAEGEGGAIAYADEDENERNQEEDLYDSLVPLFFR